MNNAAPPEPPPEELPHVPGFGSWRTMYIAVLGLLVIYVMLMAAWSRWFE
jgi:hypothetical protein